MSRPSKVILKESALKYLLCDDRGYELLRNLVALFEIDTPKRIQIAQKQASSKSSKELSYTIHVMKANAYKLGLVEMTRICEAIESSLSAADYKEINNYLHTIRVVFDDSIEALKGKLEELRPAP